MYEIGLKAGLVVPIESAAALISSEAEIHSRIVSSARPAAIFVLPSTYLPIESIP